MWKLGDEAVFDCDPRHKNYTIPIVYASPQLLAKYKTWVQIHKKHVVICQIVNTSLNTVKVYLKDDGPLYTFTVDGQWLLKPQAQAPAGCTCSNHTLMIKGCVCGHFTREKSKVSMEATPW
jgi:hypothetical protein